MHGSPVGKLWTTEPSDAEVIGHLTSTETVVMGISASEECVGERRKARREDCVRPPRQRTSAGMEAEYQAVSGSVWIYFSHRIFYYLDFFSYFFLIFF